MSASKQAKAAGLKSLKQVSDITGVSAQTLTSWHSHRKQLFAVVLTGARQYAKNNPTTI